MEETVEKETDGVETDKGETQSAAKWKMQSVLEEKPKSAIHGHLSWHNSNSHYKPIR